MDNNILINKGEFYIQWHFFLFTPLMTANQTLIFLINFTKCNYVLIAETHVAPTMQNF
jgi:hypothetical protein